MKVRATRLGYYGDRRRKPGEVFELRDRERRGKPYPAEEQFSATWMEKLDNDQSSDSFQRHESKPAPLTKRKSSVI